MTCTPPVTPSEEDPNDPATSDPNDPFNNFTPDANIFTAAPDPAQLTELATDDGGTITFAVNIVLLLMEEDANREDVDEAVAAIDGTIVGQVPAVGLYQIEVPATTIAELDAAIDRAEDDVNVAYAGYDAAPSILQECPAFSDNTGIIQIDQCPFVETEYFQALTMFDIFRPYLEVNRVTVGVIDTGLDPSTTEMDDVDILWLNDVGGTPSDPHPILHGTAVAGIIAADDDGSGVNGMASRFLNDRMNLVVGRMEGNAGSAIAYTNIACAAGADVVNISLTWDDRNPQFEVIWHAWLRTLGLNSDALFCVSAGNDSREVDGVNHAPAGIDLPNVLTVAATAACDPTSLAGFSNYGPGVDVAAPGENFPCISTGGFYRPLSGTSMAAPVVASLGAILKSLDPTLAPRQLARYITERSLIINPDTRHGRAVFSNAINQLLVDMNVGDPVQSWIDPMGLRTHGASAIVLSRICPQGISLTVDSYGFHELRSPDDDIGLGALGSALSPPTIFLSCNTDEVVFTIASSTLPEFALGSYPLVRDPGPAGCEATFVEQASLDGGVALSGILTLDMCRIEQRSPFNGVDPWVVVVNGAYEGVLEIGHFDGSDPTIHEFHGEFALPMTVADLEQLHEYLENNCEGGLPSLAHDGSDP
jgi:subtilisin family serine protease